MSKLPGYEETVICPYNKCHVILKSRISMHLSKCAKQHPEIKLEECPFDTTHRIRQEDMNVRFFMVICHYQNCSLRSFFFIVQAHQETCPSRHNFDRYVYRIDTNNAPQGSGSQPKPPTHQKHKYEDDEDWD